MRGVLERSHSRRVIVPQIATAMGLEGRNYHLTEAHRPTS